MGLVRAETVDLCRGGLPINPLLAWKGETFDRPWHIHGGKRGCGILTRIAATYAILRIGLHLKTTNLQVESRICEMRCVCTHTWRVFSSCFLTGVWRCLVQTWECKARHSSILRQECQRVNNRRVKRRKVMLKKIYMMLLGMFFCIANGYFYTKFIY